MYSWIGLDWIGLDGLDQRACVTKSGITPLIVAMVTGIERERERDKHYPQLQIFIKDMCVKHMRVGNFCM